MKQDARVWQLAVLGGVLLFGVFSLDFSLSLGVIGCTLASGILGEYLLSALPRAGRSPRPLSASISALSVLLLFRSTVFSTYPLVTLIAVSSKYVIRFRGRHWLNPTNCGVLTGVLLLPGWISSGQWGHTAMLPLALGGFGILVLLRAGRLDSALTFLGVSILLEFARIIYYGYSFAVLTHRFHNGALWLFTFYMLTDPKRRPRQCWGRGWHRRGAALVASFLAERSTGRDSLLGVLLFARPV